MQRDVRKTLDRLLPRLEPFLADAPPPVRAVFLGRLETLFPPLASLLHRLYGDRLDFFYHLEQILVTAAQYNVARTAELHRLDAQREADPLWFQSEQMMGGVCYVDLFAGDLDGIRAKIPYFKELGLTYLHLMPLFKAPAENSDGGYAVSSFREVNPTLGTMEQLRALTAEFRAQGISLVLDFVFNHTSDEHEWALKAQAGDPDYHDYYLIFPDRRIPDQYEPMLREIFPDQAPGSFSYRPDMGQWVWTTFNTFQWDLNYRNPEVFNAMLGEMLFLANVGVEVLRLDAVAFIWKELGTTCENLPQAHWIIQAYNLLVRLVAPSMLFKSEAIVHPDDVAKYFGEGEQTGYECPISYNPTLMALLWETLATREVRLLHHSMAKRLAHPANCAWVNYVRVHDDIGWSFADEDARDLYMNGFDHRQFLNQFYTGQFEGSFAKGLIFNYNPLTKDGRITGTCASLAGLEAALEANDPTLTELAIRRILLLHSVILSIGGIPLLYLGDEVGTLNDYRYADDPGKSDDSRWVHRPFSDPQRLAERLNPQSIPGRVYQPLLKLIHLRKAHPIFANGTTQILESGNPHVFSYVRWLEGQALLGVVNFSEQPQALDLTAWRVYGLKPHLTDLVSGATIALKSGQVLDGCSFWWLMG